VTDTGREIGGHTYTYIHINTHTHIQTNIHTYMQTYSNMQMQTDIHTNT